MDARCRTEWRAGSVRRIRHRLRSIQSTRCRLPYWKIDTKTTFDPTDFRNISPRFTPEARGANQTVVDLLKSIADSKGGTPAQVALAWLLAKKRWIVPIPGTTKLHRLEENLGAVNIQLTVGDLRAIEAAVAKIEIQGLRLPETVLKMSER